MPVSTPITRVYVAVCARDFHLARLCVASIRYWHPRIPISLIPDYQAGEFDCRPLMRDWQVDVFPTEIRCFGSGISKLEPLFLPRGDRFLILDADLVLLGPVVDLLDGVAGDFVVHPREQAQLYTERDTYVLGRLAAFDPTFVPPGFVFNTGQFVATPGLLQRSDFDGLIEWTAPRRQCHPEIFKCAEQGLLNYVLFRKAAAGQITLGRQEFFLQARWDEAPITVEDLARRTSPPQLYHWAGYKGPTLDLMPRADFLRFYQRLERRKMSWRSRLAYARRSWSRQKMREALARFRWRWRQWRAGFPFVFGGEGRELPPDNLRHFHNVERAGGKSWIWSQPEAAFILPLRPGRYRVVLETGSPHPMKNLRESHLRLYLNDVEIAPGRLRITEGTVKLDLEPGDFQAVPPQVLRFTIDRLAGGAQDERPLGLPVHAFRVFRRGRLSQATRLLRFIDDCGG